MIELGSRVRDRITSVEGVVTGRSEFLYCSPRLQVTLTTIDGVKPVEPLWFDEGQMEVMESSTKNYGMPWGQKIQAGQTLNLDSVAQGE